MRSPSGSCCTSSAIAASDSARAEGVGVDRSETDVVAHRVRHELGHLGQERRVRRHEEGAAVVEGDAVPAHLADDVGLPRQAEQGPQQRALAGADRTGQHDELTSLHRERDVMDAGAAGVARRQFDDVESVQRHPRRPVGVGTHALLAALDRQHAGARDVAGVAAGDQLAHAVDGDRRLLAAGQHAPDHPRQEAQVAEVGDEEGERPDVERTGCQGTGADEQHEPEPDVGRALAERHDALVEDAVAHRGLPAVVDEALQPGEHGVGGVVDLDRRGRRHDVADQTGHGGRGLAVVGAVLLDAPVERLGREDDADQRHEQHGGGDGVGRAEQDAGGDGEHQPARHVDHAVDELGDVLGVVAEVGQRLARRANRLPGLGTATGDLRGEQVGRAAASACAPTTWST